MEEWSETPGICDQIRQANGGDWRQPQLRRAMIGLYCHLVSTLNLPHISWRRVAAYGSQGSNPISANLMRGPWVGEWLLSRRDRLIVARHEVPGPGVWTFVGGQVREFAPTGLEDSAQGFNPGNRPPERRALKGRQNESANNVEVGSNCGTFGQDQGFGPTG
jgi:hypothetical protein